MDDEYQEINQEPAAADIPVDLLSACELVDELSNVHYLPVFQPALETCHLTLQYLPTQDQAYENLSTNQLTNAELNTEITIQKQMTELLHEAQEHARNLYTWRGMFKIFNDSRQGNVAPEDNELCLEVMKPQIDKVSQIYDFHKRATLFLAKEIEKISRSEKSDKTNIDFHSETGLVTMGKLLAMFVALENLMQYNVSFVNDFSNYHRTRRQARQGQHMMGTEDQELMMMQTFYASSHPITTKLFQELQALDKKNQISQVMPFFSNLAKTVAQNYLSGKYILHSEKEEYLKILYVCLQFLWYRREGPMTSQMKVDTFKEYFKSNERSLITQCFQDTVVLKDFGDLPIDLTNDVKDITKLSEKQSSIRLAELQNEHGAVVARLMTMTRDYNHVMEVHRPDDPKVEQFLDEVAPQWYELGRKCLACLSNITGSVLSLYAWKMSHGSKESNIPDGATNYSRVTKHNYTSEEKTTITIAIGLAKDLQKLMLKYEDIFCFTIGRYTFSELQSFLNVRIPRTLAKAKSKVQQDLTPYVEILKRIAQRQLDPIEKKKHQHGHDHDKHKKHKKSQEKINGEEQLPKASIGPGNTQLYMIRSLIEWLLACKKMEKKCPELAELLKDFHDRSFYWQYLLNFSTYTVQAGDMSQMWFRETFLTMERTSTIQFGRDESLPWILAENIFGSYSAEQVGSSRKNKENVNPEGPERRPAKPVQLSRNWDLIDSCLVPFELYNDSAVYVLTVFKKQHLYEELEAEVHLSFGEMLSLLNNHIYENCMDRAAYAYVLDNYPKDLRSSKLPPPNKLNYKWLLQQTQLHFLGEAVNLRANFLENQQKNLLRDIRQTVKYFRSNALNYLREFGVRMHILEHVHKILSEDLELPSFEELFLSSTDRARRDAPLRSLRGLMIDHVIEQLETVVLPFYKFSMSAGRAEEDGRLTKSLLSEPFPDKPVPKQLSLILEARSSYTKDIYTKILRNKFNNFYRAIIDEHYRVMLQYIGTEGLCAVMNECRRLLCDHLTRETYSLMTEAEPHPTLFNFILKLRVVQVSQCKHKAKSQAYQMSLMDLHHNFQNIVNYGDLNWLVQKLNEVGNCLILVNTLERVQRMEESQRFASSAMFSGLLHQKLFLNMMWLTRCNERRAGIQHAQQARQWTPDMEKKYGEAVKKEATQYVGMKQELMQKNVIFKFVDENDHVTRSNLAEALAQPDTTKSIFCSVLLQLQTMIAQSGVNYDCLRSPEETFDPEAYRGDPRTGKKISWNETLPFHWIWTAILLALGNPPTPNCDLDIQDQYGDGVSMAGCALLALLGQSERFQATDFTGYLRAVADFQKAKNGGSGDDPLRMIEQSYASMQLPVYFNRMMQLRRLTNQHLALIHNAIRSFPTPQEKPVHIWPPPVRSSHVPLE